VLSVIKGYKQLKYCGKLENPTRFNKENKNTDSIHIARSLGFRTVDGTLF